MTEVPRLGPNSLLIIIVNWNSWSETANSVRLLEDTRKPFFQVLVVDNGTRVSVGDPDISYCAGVARIIRLSGNLGFAHAANLGLRLATDEGYEAALLLNPDAAITGDAIETLYLALMGSPSLAVVGPTLCRDREGGLKTAGGRVSILTLSTRHLPPSLEVDSHLNLDVDFVEGSCMMLKLSAVNQVGCFDERFFVFWEEVDLCLRLRRCGFTVGCLPHATALHPFKSYATPLRSYLYLRSTLLFAKRHYPKELFLVLPASLAVGTLRGVISLARRAPCEAAWVMITLGTEALGGLQIPTQRILETLIARAKSSIEPQGRT